MSGHAEAARRPDVGRRTRPAAAGRRRTRGYALMNRVRQRHRGARDGECSLFFATDLHGSETCFRKFVAAAKFYGVDALILGGDTSGKFLVPIVAAGGDRWTADMFGRHREPITEEVPGSERPARQTA